MDLSVPGGAGHVAARLFDARHERAPGPLVLFFHGGGFVIGDLASHASLCAQISRSLDRPVLAVDYRLAPEHPWPAAPDDCEAVARWAACGPAVLGRGVTSLVACGDSAGGNLAIVTAMSLRDRPAAVPVVAQFVLYPLADAERDTPSARRFAHGYLLTRESLAYSAGAYRADAADLRHAPMRGELAGMPAAVVATAGVDPIRDQGRAYAAALALALAGVPAVFQEAAGNIHGFATLRRAIGSSVDDLAQALAAAKATVAGHAPRRSAGSLRMQRHRPRAGARHRFECGRYGTGARRLSWPGTAGRGSRAGAAAAGTPAPTRRPP
ncbi:alpha/beta hydrolase [Burkholderia perseverans]|uniref:alpha/beta hydrolase n=1 Tax=Burkholderia perseverans TaxID=2615214 RepID=UPI001FF01BF4|nr:alpha/beta hydrolase [Burkholderia perseverans]